MEGFLFINEGSVAIPILLLVESLRIHGGSYGNRDPG